MLLYSTVYIRKRFKRIISRLLYWIKQDTSWFIKSIDKIHITSAIRFLSFNGKD